MERSWILGSPLLAHGIGDASDLGLSAELLLGGSAAIVVGVAAWLSGRGARRGVADAPPLWSRTLPPGLAGALDHRAGRALLQTAGLLLFVALLAVALVGAPTGALNPAPRLLVTGLWVTIVVLGSLLLGPLWRAMNPLRTVSAALAWLSGDREEQGTAPLPAGAGVWLAGGTLLAFVWMEHTLPAEPGTVRAFVALYAVVMLAGAMVYGRGWFPAADGLEAASTTLGALAPLGRGPDGAWRLRSPRAGLRRFAVRDGVVLVLGAIIGGNVFDGVAHTSWWATLRFSIVGGQTWLGDTLGVLAAVGLATLLLAVSCRGRPYLLAAFVPVAAAHAVAHYIGPLLIDGQVLWGQLADPFAKGGEAAFAAEPYADYEVLPGWTVAAAQLAALVGGHALGAAAAHDAATARHDLRTARAVQFPVRALLVASVVAGVALRFPPA